MNRKRRNYYNIFLILSFFIVCSVYCQNDGDEISIKFIPNLTPKCLECLCVAATGCDKSLGCSTGYCGPFKMSRLYWIDGGRETLPEDDPKRAGAFEDCAISRECAERAIKGYFEKYAKDCNGDGVTDCLDYSMINFNGGTLCELSLRRDENARNWTYRFNDCFYK